MKRVQNQPKRIALSWYLWYFNTW